MKETPYKISKFVDYKIPKHLFTAGPASLIEENITGLRPCLEEVIKITPLLKKVFSVI